MDQSQYVLSLLGREAIWLRYFEDKNRNGMTNKNFGQWSLGGQVCVSGTLISAGIVFKYCRRVNTQEAH